MTYNVFDGTLNLAQSINDGQTICVEDSCLLLVHISTSMMSRHLSCICTWMVDDGHMKQSFMSCPYLPCSHPGVLETLLTEAAVTTWFGKTQTDNSLLRREVSVCLQQW